MKRESKASKFVFIRWLSVTALVIAMAWVWLVARPDRGHEAISAAPTNSSAPQVSVAKPASATVVPPAPIHPSALSAAGRLPVPAFSWFQPHPFKVVQSNAVYAWTAEDGKDTNVIRQLAHNELEYQRMVDENGKIYRRQLVYHPEGFTLQAQQSSQSGQGIQQLTLPGLDGEEVPVVVTKTDFESGGDRGLFYGKLPDRPDSMVTVAFINGREAFTVVSPQDQIYLQAEAREPGEIVVKKFDPQTYSAKACGNP